MVLDSQGGHVAGSHSVERPRGDKVMYTIINADKLLLQQESSCAFTCTKTSNFLRKGAVKLYCILVIQNLFICVGL